MDAATNASLPFQQPAQAAASEHQQQHVVTLSFEALPERSVSLLLFADVTNARDMRARAPQQLLRHAFINAAAVPGLLPLHVAAQRALAAEAAGALATKSLASELLYRLSGTGHIGESLRRCGIADDTRHVLVALFDASEADVAEVQQLVQGSARPLADLAALADPALVAKHYKISEAELSIGSAEEAAACRIAGLDCL